MKRLIIIIITVLLAMGSALDFTHAAAGRDPAPEFAPESEPAFDWEGELDPNEFDKWKVISVQPSTQGLFWIYIKNPDENSPIDVVAMVVDEETVLFGYRYFKYGIPHSFIFNSAQRKYVRKPLTQKEKNRCKNCHESNKISNGQAI